MIKMPIYKFKCSKCKNEFEDLVTHRGDKTPCPDCGSKKVERMVSIPAPHVSKGSTSNLSCADGACDVPTGYGCTDGTCPLM